MLMLFLCVSLLVLIAVSLVGIRVTRFLAGRTRSATMHAFYLLQRRSRNKELDSTLTRTAMMHASEGSYFQRPNHILIEKEQWDIEISYEVSSAGKDTRLTLFSRGLVPLELGLRFASPMGKQTSRAAGACFQEYARHYLERVDWFPYLLLQHSEYQTEDDVSGSPFLTALRSCSLVATGPEDLVMAVLAGEERPFIFGRLAEGYVVEDGALSASLSGFVEDPEELTATIAILERLADALTLSYQQLPSRLVELFHATEEMGLKVHLFELLQAYHSATKEVRDCALVAYDMGHPVLRLLACVSLCHLPDKERELRGVVQDTSWSFRTRFSVINTLMGALPNDAERARYVMELVSWDMPDTEGFEHGILRLLNHFLEEKGVLPFLCRRFGLYDEHHMPELVSHCLVLVAKAKEPSTEGLFLRALSRMQAELPTLVPFSYSDLNGVLRWLGHFGTYDSIAPLVLLQEELQDLFATKDLTLTSYYMKVFMTKRALEGTLLSVRERLGERQEGGLSMVGDGGLSVQQGGELSETDDAEDA
jgi:hypothetical protein